MQIYFDTETTGLPNKKLPPAHPSQPKLVQLAFIVCENEESVKASHSLLIQPDGWEIPEEVSKVHGITTEAAAQYGVPLKTAIELFMSYASRATRLIAHNVGFDVSLLEYALCQSGRKDDVAILRKIPTYCTMEASRDLVALPPTERMIAAGMTGHFKSPRLSEAFEFFTGQPLVGAHDALVDVEACRTVHRHLIARDLVQI